jgi:hypothetical protein
LHPADSSFWASSSPRITDSVKFFDPTTSGRSSLLQEARSNSETRSALKIGSVAERAASGVRERQFALSFPRRQSRLPNGERELALAHSKRCA